MKITLFSVFIIWSVCILGQSLTSFKIGKQNLHDNLTFELSLAHAGITNSGAPVPELHKETALTGAVGVRTYNFDLGGQNFHYHNKMYFDLISGAIKEIRHTGPKIENTSYLSTGVFGWFDVCWNIVATEKVAVAIGPNFNDYFFGSTYFIDTLASGPGFRRKEPNGYYFSAGPTALVSLSLGKSFLLQTKYVYSMSFLRPVSANAKFDYVKGTKKPHWSRINIDLQTRWGIFAAIDYNYIINRAPIPNDTKRWEFQFGFRAGL